MQWPVGGDPGPLPESDDLPPVGLRQRIVTMSVAEWFWDQNWSMGARDWLARRRGRRRGIALRQERVEHQRAEAARALRRQVLAAAIAPVLRDMNTTARIRNGLLQTIGRARQDEPPPHAEELTIPLPEIFMTTLERIDVFGANIAAQVYVLMHRVNDYNRNVQSLREWECRCGPGPSTASQTGRGDGNAEHPAAAHGSRDRGAGARGVPALARRPRTDGDDASRQPALMLGLSRTAPNRDRHASIRLRPSHRPVRIVSL